MLLAVPRRGLKSGLVAFIVVAALLLLAFGILFDGSLSFLGNQRDRGLQVESTGALPYLLYSLVGGHVESGLTYGSIHKSAGEEIGKSWDTGNKVLAGAILVLVLGMYTYFSFWLS